MMDKKTEQRIKEIFGETLKEIRKSKEISQEKLYLSSGVDRKFIHQIEHGKQQPTLTTIVKFIHALNIPFSTFFERFSEKLKENNIKPPAR